MSIVNLGNGEIGSSLRNLYLDYDKSVFVIEKDIDIEKVKDYALNNKTKVLNVCIPFIVENQNFQEVVIKYIKILRPEMCIIHSTVEVGTTRSIKHTLEDDEEAFYTILAHSPVEGIHPHLTKSLQTFDKFIGGFSHNESTKISDHYYEMGIYSTICESPEETELAKLLSTTYYAWNIRYMQAVKEQCDALGVNFDNVYTKFNDNYNNSYYKMGMSHVIRPVLKFMDYGIGGHCLMPNAEILDNYDVLQQRLRKVVDVVLDKDELKE